MNGNRGRGYRCTASLGLLRRSSTSLSTVAASSLSAAPSEGNTVRCLLPLLSSTNNLRSPSAARLSRPVESELSGVWYSGHLSSRRVDFPHRFQEWGSRGPSGTVCASERPFRLAAGRSGRLWRSEQSVSASRPQHSVYRTPWLLSGERREAVGLSSPCRQLDKYQLRPVTAAS